MAFKFIPCIEKGESGFLMNLESGLSGFYIVIFFTIDMAGQGVMEFRQWKREASTVQF